MKNEYFYIVEKVPPKYLSGGSVDKPVWYCHRIGHPECPVWGSVGPKKKAEQVCRTYNKDGKVHYS